MFFSYFMTFLEEEKLGNTKKNKKIEKNNYFPFNVFMFFYAGNIEKCPFTNNDQI